MAVIKSEDEKRIARNEYMRKWAKTDKGKEWSKRNYKQLKERRKNNPDINRAQKLKSRYGISIEEYEQIFKKQNGVCAICAGTNSEKRLHVDHDHESGKVRGLLCFKCNYALGLLNEDTQIISTLLEYLA